MKTAVIILSDPKSGTKEALGRMFNAMAATYDFKQRGEEVELYFQGWHAMGRRSCQAGTPRAPAIQCHP